MPREPRIGQGAVQARPSGCMGPTSAPTRRGARCRVVNLALESIWWWWEKSENGWFRDFNMRQNAAYQPPTNPTDSWSIGCIQASLRSAPQRAANKSAVLRRVSARIATDRDGALAKFGVRSRSVQRARRRSHVPAHCMRVPSAPSTFRVARSEAHGARTVFVEPRAARVAAGAACVRRSIRTLF